jgi:2-iminobutanoate/2-iminopropanoate deaminase
MRSLFFSLLVAVLAIPAAAASANAQAADSLVFVRPGGANSALSGAVVAGNTIYLSGVLGSGAGPGIVEQTTAIMESIRNNLAELGATMDDVVKCTVFMADLSERPQFNEIYRSFFPNHRPARSAVGVDLGGPRVEVECIAVKMGG